MKQIFLSIMLVALSLVGMAQVVQENEAAVVYYMPKTELAIALEYDIVEQEPGAFYQYAERYLDAKDIIRENTTQYILTHVRVSPQTSADEQRVYKVTPERGCNTQLLTLSNDGRLLGYNIGNIHEHTLENPTDQNYASASAATPLMPLLEEHFMAGSVAKMAEGAAKQIYRIRETRLNLLAGDMEHVPADGMAMQLTLDELQKQEQALVDLFVGTTTKRHVTHTITYLPKQSVEQEIICRFSQHAGVVETDDLSGEPIYITINASRLSLRSAIETGEKIGTPSQIYYNLPGSANIRLQYKDQTIHQCHYPIAQFGVAIPLSKELFSGKERTTIHFNPETGNVWSIEN